MCRGWRKENLKTKTRRDDRLVTGSQERRVGEPTALLYRGVGSHRRPCHWHGRQHPPRDQPLRAGIRPSERERMPAQKNGVGLGWATPDGRESWQLPRDLRWRHYRHGAAPVPTVCQIDLKHPLEQLGQAHAGRVDEYGTSPCSSEVSVVWSGPPGTI